MRMPVIACIALFIQAAVAWGRKHVPDSWGQPMQYLDRMKRCRARTEMEAQPVHPLESLVVIGATHDWLSAPLAYQLR
jgi:hypothetical protein